MERSILKHLKGTNWRGWPQLFCLGAVCSKITSSSNATWYMRWQGKWRSCKQGPHGSATSPRQWAQSLGLSDTHLRCTYKKVQVEVPKINPLCKALHSFPLHTTNPHHKSSTGKQKGKPSPSFEGNCGSMVERLLWMQTVPDPIPDISRLGLGETDVWHPRAAILNSFLIIMALSRIKEL